MQTIVQEKLKELLTLMNESVSKKDLLDAIKKIVDFVNKLKADNQEFNASLRLLQENLAKTLKDTNQACLASLRVEFSNKAAKTFKDLEISMNLIRDKARKITQPENGRDGKDGNNGMNGKDGSPDTPEQVRDKLEILIGDDRLDRSAIKGLDEEFKRLEQIRSRTLGGGGFSAIAMQQHFINDETPTNSGDDLNFTINHTPSPASSLKVYRGGARLRITEDYTFSGQTITLLVALNTGEILLVDYMI